MEVVARWSGRKASALRAALRMTNESFGAHLGVAVRTVAKWEAHPEVVLSPATQEILDLALTQATDSAQTRFRLLIDQSEYAEQSASNVSGPLDAPLRSTGINGLIGQREMFKVAAHESTRDAVLRATHSSDALSIIHSQSVAIARRYSYRDPISIFIDARHIRDLTYQLADRTRRPSELVDLYALAGATNALMASVAFDLGHWDAARSMAESATAYSDLAGHASLEAWTWGLQATLANWRRDHGFALNCFERGLTVAPEGAPRLRLQYIAARTHAGLGNAAAVTDVLAAARIDRERMQSNRDELQDEVRGEFEFSDARAAACAAAAWLELDESTRAEEYARVALDEYFELPEETRPFSPVNGIRIDIASTRLSSRDLEGASDSLKPVLGLDPAMRNAALTGRLKSVRATLQTPTWATVSTARDLTEVINQWMSDTATVPLLTEDVN